MVGDRVTYLDKAGYSRVVPAEVVVEDFYQNTEGSW